MTRLQRADGVHTFDNLRERCWVDDDTGCWHWRGAFDSNGNASLWLPGLRRRVSLGVAVCFFRTGQGPEKGQAWHCTCKTRGCANPEHRMCGTRKSQMRALKRTCTLLQRARISAGKLRASHLTAEQRTEIAGSTDFLRVLAERYSISVSQAHKLRTGKQALHGAGSSVFTWRP